MPCAAALGILAERRRDRDNGGLLDQAGKRITSNLPLRGGKGMLYEGGIREPLFIRHLRLIRPGETGEAVTSVDFLPTLLDLAGARPTGTKPLDGISLMPVLTGNGSLPERRLYWHYPHYHREKPAGAVRQGAYKLIEWFEDGHRSLFDLSSDIGECRDLAAEMPQKADELAAALAAWRKRVGALVPVSNPAFEPLRADEQFAPAGWAEVKARNQAARAVPQGD